MDGDIPTVCQTIGVSFTDKSLFCLSEVSNGNSVALAGRRNGIYLLNLEHPWDVDGSKLKLRCPPNCDVTKLSWSGHNVGSILSACFLNHAHFWQQSQSGWVNLITLQEAHKKRINDLEWSQLEANFLASCSLDGEIKVWDARSLVTKKTAARKMKFMGSQEQAHLIKWNRFDNLALLSVHKGMVCSWDLRKANHPVSKILTSTSTVTSIDCSYIHKSQFVTCDNTAHFKVWDFETKSCLGTGRTGTVVDKAKYTPFGDGISVASRSNHVIQLFQHPKGLDPECTMTVPVQDSTLQFQWRKAEAKGETHYQILALGSQSTFKMSAVTPACLTAGKELGSASNRRASYDPNRSPIKIKMTLDQEFAYLKSKEIAGVFLKNVDFKGRTLTVHFRPSTEVEPTLELRVTFPMCYPVSPPSFTVLTNKTGSPDDLIKKDVVEIGDELVNVKGENCIEACLKHVAEKYIFDPMLSGIMREVEKQRRSSFGPNKPSSEPVPLAVQDKLKKLGPNYQTHLVKPAESMAFICLTYNMDRTELRRLNGIHHSSHIEAGALLIVKKPGQDDLLIRTRSERHSHGFGHSPPKGQLPSSVHTAFHSSSMVVKVKLHFLQDEGKPPVGGQFILTEKQLIFEPNLDDQSVVETKSVSRYTICLELSGISHALSLERPTTKKYPMSTLFIGSKKSNRVLQFAGRESKIQSICSTIQPLISSNHDNRLMDFLGLDGVNKTTMITPAKTKRSGGTDSKASSPKVRRGLEVSSPGKRKPISKPTSKATSPSNLRRSGALLQQGSAPAKIAPLNIGPERIKNQAKLFRSGSRDDIFLSQSPSVSRLAQSREISNTSGPQPLQVRLKDSMSFKQTFAPPPPPCKKKTEFESDSDDDEISRYISSSKLLTKAFFDQLHQYIPQRYQNHCWKMVFSTETDGASLLTFYNNLEDRGSTIILIGDTDGYIFGGFLSGDWKERSATKHFGNGESFVFSLSPTFERYAWTGANENFAFGTNQYFAMGGTIGRYALYIDCSFHFGTSETANTFLNRRLSNNEEFQIRFLEVWVFDD